MTASVTYLIPTHRRHGYLRRALAHYSGIRAPLVVADSSPEPLPGSLAESVTYRHFPGLGYLDKLALAVDLVKTPYVVLCADDDFTLPCAVDQCLAFLEANPGYATAQGDILCAWREAGGVRLRPANLQARDMRVESDDPGQRLLELCQPYAPTYYAVQRLEALRDYTRLASALSNYNLLELFSAMVGAVHGKHRHLPLLFCVREEASSVDPKDPRRRHGIEVVARDPAYAQEYGHFLAAAAGLLALRAGLAPDVARRAVQDSVDLFIERCCRHTPRRTFFQKLPKYLRRATALLAGQPVDPEAQARKNGEEQAVRELLLGHGETTQRELSEITARIAAGLA